MPAQTQRVNPFDQELKAAQDMGFELLVGRDGRGYQVRLNSVTARAREACVKASGRPDFDSIEVHGIPASSSVSDRLDALRALMYEAIGRARDAGA